MSIVATDLEALRRLRRTRQRLAGGADRSLYGAARPQRQRQVDAPARDRRAGDAGRRRDRDLRRGRDRARPAEARRRLRLPALRRLQAHDGPQQRGLRAGDQEAAEGGDPRTRRPQLLELVQLQQFGHRYPAQLSGGQRQRMAPPARLRSSPRCSCSTSRSALDARVRAELREWLRRLHEEVHVTTVFVTHDQEEAMRSPTRSR